MAGSEQIGSGIIMAVAQDQRGLLWLSAPDGLYSYDGLRLRAVVADPRDPHRFNNVRALLAHSDGSLWVAPQSGDIWLHDPRADRSTRMPVVDGSIPAGKSALAFAEGAGGDVWIGLFGAGVAHWNRARRSLGFFLPDPQDEQSPRNTVRALLRDRRGDLWLGTRDGLYRLRSGALALERVASGPDTEDGFDRQYVYSLFEARDGRVWIGTQSHGAAILDPVSMRVQRLPAGGPAGLSHPWISGFVEPQAGRVWICTYGGGIDIVAATDGRVLQRVRSDPSLPGGLALDRLTGPVVDSAGLVWVPSWGAGLQKHNPNNADAFASVRHANSVPRGLSFPSVLSILPLDAGQVWVGTGGNGIDVLDPQTGVVAGYRPHPTRAGALREGTVRAMLRAPDGSIWVATQHGGLQRYRPETDDFAEPLASLTSGTRVRHLLGRADGRIVLGMESNLADFDPRTGLVQPLREADGREFSTIVWALAEDDRQRLWIGSPVALHLLDATSPRPRAIDASLRLAGTTGIELDANGGLWFSGPGRLARLSGWRDGEPLVEDLSAILPAGSALEQMQSDGAGRLWSPYLLFDPAARRVEVLGGAESIDIGNVATAASSQADGRLYFGGTRGLLIVEPERFQPWRFEAPLVITSVDIDGSRFGGDPLLGLRLQPGQRRLSIEFAALDYSAPAAIRYQYRLSGLDEAWIETDASLRVASFNNLWPGDYGLEVRALTRTGEWSRQPLVVPLTVLPAWWQTPLAMVIAILGLLAAVWAALRWRTLRLRAQARELGELVEARTAELRSSNQQLESAHARLVGTQQQLVMQEKMAALGTLTAGIAHEINNPTNFADGAVQQLQRQLADFHQFLRQLAGADAPLRVLEAIAARFRELEEMTSTAREGHERVKRIVADLRQFTRLDEAERKSVPIAEPIQSTVNLVRTRFDRIRFELDLAFNPAIECQPAKLGQVFLNLVVNACEAIGDCTDGREGVVRIATQPVDGSVEVVVEDNGAGMIDATRQRVFEPFFTTKDVGAGTGLGLAIVFGIVRDHGGSIDVESAPGRGTRFRLRLPASRPGEDGWQA